MGLRKAFWSQRAAWMIGVAVTVLFASAVLFGLNATHGMPLAPRKTLKAAFHDLNGLVVGDDVRIASTRVGYVDDIRVEGGRAVAILKIDDENMRVFRNATAANASVGARSALGQKFVDLDPGSHETGELDNGALIPERATRGAHEISELFDVFDDPTRRATGSVLRELGGGLGGHERDLHDSLRAAPHVLPDLGAVSRSLAVRDGQDLTGLLHSADSLTSRFQNRQQELAGLTEQLDVSLNAMAVDGGKPVEDILRRAPGTLREARGALDALNRPLVHTEKAASVLRPGAESLGAATPDLRGVLREGVPPLAKVPGVARTGQPAVTELTGVMDDARPVAAQLVDTANRAATPLSVLAPYSGEIANYFTLASSALSHGDSAGNWLRIYLVPHPESVSGTVPVKDPTVSRNPYPEPGQAARDSARAPIQGGPR